MAVLQCVVKMSADRPDRDGSGRPVTIVTDGDCLSVRDRLRNYRGIVVVCRKMSADRPDRDGS